MKTFLPILLVSAFGTLLPFGLLGSAAVVTATPTSNSNDNTVGSPEDYPPGDPRRCLEVARKNGYKVQRFEVLPGLGWDNLRNVDQGQVVSYNFSLCRTTDDGRFLLPDTVGVVPIKASNVETFAELIEHWKNWTSTTSRSINVDAGLHIGHFGISGKFSASFEDMKGKQIGDKSVTTRAQIRYVRDFGTHVVTRTLAGAALVQVDHLRDEWVNSQEEHKSDILASASASLFSVFHMSASYETKTDEKFMQSYLSQRTSSVVKTLGGPLFKPANFTPDIWAEAVDMDLVYLDRAGDPLYYLVTPSVLPELPAATLNKLEESVREAVKAYYQFNVWPGCLDQDSLNFSPAANVDDGSCHPPSSNLSFGGVYQTCSSNPSWSHMCNGKTQVNPITGSFSCPPRYQAIRLYQGGVEGCERVWFFWRRCGIRATYDMVWCVATDPVPDQSGYLFGGVYTTTVVNPITRTFACPPNFFALTLGGAPDLQVCISDDFEFGDHYAVPFGGFLSCQAGNPLAVKQRSAQVTGKQGSSKSSSGSGPSGSTLRAFFRDDAGAWPKRCPDGFSKHMATIEQHCEINYCVRTGAMSGPALPPVKRPPFVPSPPVLDPPTGSFIFDPTSRSWSRQSQSHPSSHSSASSGMSPGAAAGISIGATLACLVLATVGVLAVRRRRRRGRSGYRSLQGQDPLVVQHGDYGSNASTAFVSADQ
ncbi:hypothetical protein BaRGS_00012575 [Batillaria attramentaria]|uniref:MACPF domain-containing protein n=1 Tax=Batillaria attramentaria TaxID=370345 RepID=A0ABD0LAC3_9CAEN